MLQQVYINKNVLDAAKERIDAIFSEFENIVVSVSGGKDSTVLAHLVLSRAQELKRKVKVFSLDTEAAYQATIDQVKYLMFDMFPDSTIPIWWQIPLRLESATSILERYFIAWDEDKEEIWLRKKDPRAIKAFPYGNPRILEHREAYKEFNGHQKNTCILLGIRADESKYRRITVANNAGYKNWLWSTDLKNSNILAYPIYDWTFSDIWKYIFDNNIRYDKIYDYMWLKGLNLRDFRISTLIKKKSIRTLTEMPEFEPETFDKLIRRLQGIVVAHLYGKDKKGLAVRDLPKNFNSWIDYRDFLLSTYPDDERKQIFSKRFASQPQNNYVARQQCRQLILNNSSNTLQIDTKGINAQSRKERIVQKWKNLL